MKRKRETVESESRENVDNGNQSFDSSEKYIQTCLKVLKAFEKTNKHMLLPPYNRGVAFFVLDYFLKEFNETRKEYHEQRSVNDYENLDEFLESHKIIFQKSLSNLYKDIVDLSLTPEVLSSFLKSVLTFPIGKFILDREFKDNFKENRKFKRIQLEIARAINFNTGNCATYSALFFYHLQKLKLENAYIIGLRAIRCTHL